MGEIITFPPRPAPKPDLPTALAAFGRACLSGMVGPAEIEAAARDFERRMLRICHGGDVSPFAVAPTALLALVAIQHAGGRPDGAA